jgi:hypothetical protein
MRECYFGSSSNNAASYNTVYLKTYFAHDAVHVDKTKLAKYCTKCMAYHVYLASVQTIQWTKISL